jgi:hypothetical protein
MMRPYCLFICLPALHNKWCRVAREEMGPTKPSRIPVLVSLSHSSFAGTLQNTSSGLSFSLILRRFTYGCYRQKEDNKQTLQNTSSGFSFSLILCWVTNGFHRKKENNKRTLQNTSSGLSFPLILRCVTNGFPTQNKDTKQSFQNRLAELDIPGKV